MASEGVGDGSKRKREGVDDAVDGDAADVLATLARAANSMDGASDAGASEGAAAVGPAPAQVVYPPAAAARDEIPAGLRAAQGVEGEPAAKQAKLEHKCPFEGCSYVATYVYSSLD